MQLVKIVTTGANEEVDCSFVLSPYLTEGLQSIGFYLQSKNRSLFNSTDLSPSDLAYLLVKHYGCKRALEGESMQECIRLDLSSETLADQNLDADVDVGFWSKGVSADLTWLSGGEPDSVVERLAQYAREAKDVLVADALDEDLYPLVCIESRP